MRVWDCYENQYEEANYTFATKELAEAFRDRKTGGSIFAIADREVMTSLPFGDVQMYCVSVGTEGLAHHINPSSSEEGVKFEVSRLYFVGCMNPRSMIVHVKAANRQDATNSARVIAVLENFIDDPDDELKAMVAAFVGAGRK